MIIIKSELKGLFIVLKQHAKVFLDHYGQNGLIKFLLHPITCSFFPKKYLIFKACNAVKR